MCGICGFTYRTENLKFDPEDHVVRMAKTLAHRGPDAAGHAVYRDENTTVGLGHRRLSIIDLSPNANQPLSNEDGSICVVYNGEIYNYPELRAELINNGHRFRSHGDTEVLVHLYEEHGDDCMKYLEGMFAFALLDKKKKKVLLARDRMGIKPLYYSSKNYRLIFASEIKSLLCNGDISRNLSLAALDYFVTYGYIPGSETIFEDIKKLPPAGYLSYRYDDGTVDLKNYWEINYLPKFTATEEELSEQLLALLRESIDRHLISDVPVGAFLSGGMDSSVLVAMMHRGGGNRTHTFSLGYSGGGRDELAYSSAVSRQFQTRHREIKVRPDVSRNIPRLLWHLDEPFFDNSIIPTYLISQFARDDVKVAISGDGGDELFGGYEWARRNQYRQAFATLCGPLGKAIHRKRLNRLGVRHEYGTDLKSLGKRMFYDLTAGIEDGYRRRTTVSSEFRNQLYSGSLKTALNGFDAVDLQHRIFQKVRVDDERERMLYTDTRCYLPDDCLFKVDRMSMAHGLEVRVPFLDRKLVEFAARLPFKFKIRGLTTKYILKKTAAPLLPGVILKQRKQGFTIPISDWLRRDLGPIARSILLSQSFKKRNLFNFETVEWMLEQHAQRKQEFGHRIWSLVIFETWARLYLDEKITAKPDVSLDVIADN